MRHEIRQLLEGFIEDIGLFSREDFTQKLRNYMKQQLQHLNTEEAQLFPLITDALSQTDWEQIAERTPEANDPLFGKHVSDNYKNLFEYIVKQ